MPVMRFRDFSGGLYLPQNLNLPVPINALLQAQNVIPFPGGDGSWKLRGRRGRVHLNTSDPLNLFYLIHRHYPKTGAASTVVWYLDGGVVKQRKDSNDNWVWETGFGEFNATDAIPYGVVWPLKNASYFTNGADGLRKYDGTNLSEVTLTGGVFSATSADIGPYITVWKGRLWATKQDEITYSLYSTEVASDSSWLPTNQLSLSDALGGTIVGIVPRDDMLLGFKTTGLWRFIGDVVTGGQLAEYSKYGCIAPRSIASTPHGVIYVARDGVRITDGQSPFCPLISDPISTLFVSPSTQTTYSTAVGVYVPRWQQYWLKLTPTATDAYVAQFIHTHAPTPDVGGAGGGEGEGWMWLYYTNIPYYAATIFDSASDNGRFVAGDSVGKVWDMDTGTLDDTTAIVSVVQTAFVPFTEDLRLGRAYQIRTIHRSKEVLTAGIRYDGSATNTNLVSMGGTYPDYRYQSDTYPLFTRITNGRYISTVITFPAGSYENELHEILLQFSLRGPRITEKNTGT